MLGARCCSPDVVSRCAGQSGHCGGGAEDVQALVFATNRIAMALTRASLPPDDVLVKADNAEHCRLSVRSANAASHCTDAWVTAQVVGSVHAGLCVAIVADYVLHTTRKASRG